jgi:replication factor C subunit 2/4
VKYNAAGLEALIFTAEGDMRQAINNLQSTWSGFGYVNDENVFKVCDQPHPVMVNAIIASCLQVNVDNALQGIHQLWRQGYSAVDIITTLFRVVKFYDGMPEYMKLDYIKVPF